MTGPMRVSSKHIKALLEELGVDWTSVRFLSILPPGTLLVEFYKRNEQGHRYAEGDHAAFETVEATVDWDAA